VRLLIVSPDSTGTACPLSGRNSTYRPVQISGGRLYDPENLDCTNGDERTSRVDESRQPIRYT
jgi:hypothetical protein